MRSDLRYPECRLLVKRLVEGHIRVYSCFLCLLIEMSKWEKPLPYSIWEKTSEIRSKFEVRFLGRDEIFCIQTKTQQNHIFYYVRNTENEVSGIWKTRFIYRCQISGHRGYVKKSESFFSGSYRQD